MSADVPTPRSPTALRRRSVARLAAVQALYQIDLSGAPPAAVVAEFQKHRLGREQDGENYGEADTVLFADIVNGVIARQADLDTALSAALTADWPLERLETVLRPSSIWMTVPVATPTTSTAPRRCNFGKIATSTPTRTRRKPRGSGPMASSPPI